MTHRAVFHPRLEADLREAMAHYEDCSPDLGVRFKNAFYATLDGTLLFPGKHAVKVDKEIRTHLMRPFPYLIFYAVIGEIVFVLALQYAGRKPAYLRTLVTERRATE